MCHAFGGKGYDVGYGIAVDNTGNVYVLGQASLNFPLTPNAYDATYNGGRDMFLAMLSATGGNLLYSTHFGGVLDDDNVGGLVTDGSGNIYLAGNTTFYNFPITSGAYQPPKASNSDAFVVKFDIESLTSIIPAPSPNPFAVPRGP
ncbi:MAG: SBBP repeat-containing protein [Bacteroidia bacterium]